MAALKIICGISCLLLLFDCGFLSNSSRAQSTLPFKLEANDILWNRLSYRTKNFFVTVATDVHLKTIPTKEAGEFLITVPQGVALQAEGTQIFAITAHSVIDPLFGSTNTFQTKAWYNQKNTTVLQRIRLRQGNEKWEKTYRFNNKGVFRLRKKPNNSGEAKLPLERWTNVEESFFSYDLSNAGCLGILEPSVLLYLVSAIDFTLGKKNLNLCVFNKKQLHKVQIRPEGLKRLKVSYTEKSKESEISRKGEIDSVKISFKTHSLAGQNQASESFSLLGLKGDFDIFIDKNSKLPVQITGKIPKVGRVDIKLREVRLKPSID